MRIRAITIDLDDTLWPIDPVITRAEERLDLWLRTHCPPAAQQYPPSELRALRDRIAVANPHLSHDFTTQRMLCLSEVLQPYGYGEDHVAAAFAEFHAARNEVECYSDALPALQRLSARFPIVSLSNGNADLERIGLAHYFRFSISSRDFGKAKPAVEIFHAACAGLELTPEEVLHVGDDPELDILGAHAAGMRSCWLNRNDATWRAERAPDLIVHDLNQLADFLDALPDAA